MSPIKTLAVLSSLSLIGLSQFSSAETDGTYGLSPMAGYFLYDNDLPLDDHSVLGINLGYRIDQRWGAELEHLVGSTHPMLNSNDVDTDILALNGLYHFGDPGKYQPFLLVGLGQQSLDMPNRSDEDTLLVTGMGYKIALTDTIQLRPDVRMMNNLDKESLSVGAMVGLTWLIGGNTSSGSYSLEIKDADGDGVKDGRDMCPNSPAGEKVNRSGCPISADQDRDGVEDSKDQCPDSAPGAVVDDKGCYILLQESKEVQLQVEFENNSYVVKKSSYGEIEQVVEFMKKYPLTQAILEGHTDSSGPEEYNQKLSYNRAQAVAKLMSSHYGIAADRLKAVGFGEAKPLVANDTPANRAKNRRVTAKITATVNKIKK